MFGKRYCISCKIQLSKNLKVARTDKCIRCWQNQAFKSGIKTGIKNSRIIVIIESRDENNKKMWTTEI
jgi:hypothetical protein